MRVLQAQDLETWRAQARALLASHTTPLEVTWAEETQPALFGEEPLPTVREGALTVPPAFMSMARTIACHRDVRRWDLLYQLLFRLTHGERNLLQITTDPLIHALGMMEKSIRRDAHKAKAFVRFREVREPQGNHYIAWHQPDHRILPMVAPFFSRRFSTMDWTILTPDQSVHWDQQQLHYGPGVPASQAPEADVLEDLWRNYYRATFNPARIKIAMMKREMPVRYWKTLPEAEIIHDILAEAPERVQAMLKHTEGMERSAADFLPADQSIEQLRAAIGDCKGCELYQRAHQPVFGEGPVHARIMLVGEQPGNEEDQQGRPFVGPAGQLLDEVLHEVGLQRSDLYITNAVKHFRFLYRDSFRQHQTPSRYHVTACKPWLTAEIAAVKPKVVVCLGNTAARALISPNFVMRDGRGQLIASEPGLLATYHPSAILRAPQADQTSMRRALAEDLLAARHAELEMQ